MKERWKGIIQTTSSYDGAAAYSFGWSTYNFASTANWTSPPYALTDPLLPATWDGLLQEVISKIRNLGSYMDPQIPDDVAALMAEQAVADVYSSAEPYFDG